MIDLSRHRMGTQGTNPVRLVCELQEASHASVKFLGLSDKAEDKIMRSMAQFVLAASFLAGMATGPLAVQAADQRTTQGGDQWRYTFHNSEWWYWLPANRWVYWRANRWNAYDPTAYTAPASSDAVATSRGGSTYEGRAAINSDIRPFYGHALSSLDQRPLEENGEVGPFYGHALPGQFSSPWRSHWANRPFYGHAVSSYDY